VPPVGLTIKLDQVDHRQRDTQLVPVHLDPRLALLRPARYGRARRWASPNGEYQVESLDADASADSDLVLQPGGGSALQRGHQPRVPAQPGTRP
jgi:hypothetical protein